MSLSDFSEIIRKIQDFGILEYRYENCSPGPSHQEVEDAYASLQEALEQTIDWWKAHYENQIDSEVSALEDQAELQETVVSQQDRNDP